MCIHFSVSFPGPTTPANRLHKSTGCNPQTETSSDSSSAETELSVVSFKSRTAHKLCKPRIPSERATQHPWRLTWNIIMDVWKIIFLSTWVICRFHVNLPGWNPQGKLQVLGIAQLFRMQSDSAQIWKFTFDTQVWKMAVCKAPECMGGCGRSI